MNAPVVWRTGDGGTEEVADFFHTVDLFFIQDTPRHTERHVDGHFCPFARWFTNGTLFLSFSNSHFPLFFSLSHFRFLPPPFNNNRFLKQQAREGFCTDLLRGTPSFSPRFDSTNEGLDRWRVDGCVVLLEQILSLLSARKATSKQTRRRRGSINDRPSQVTIDPAQHRR